MRIILVYDVGEKRVTKMLHLCREYLNRIQNSVFEGDITDSSYYEFVSRIKKTVDLESDSVIIFKVWTTKYVKEVIGVQKNPIDNIL